MNTNGVAQLLGVSSSTVKRWVKQLGLRLEKNEFGHFIYNEGDIQRLVSFQSEVQLDSPKRSITVDGRALRKGIVTIRAKDKKVENLMSKVEYIEERLERKADSSVTYQLLHHRREIEEMQNQIKELTERLAKLETKKTSSIPLITEHVEQPKRKKKKLVTTFFGF
ncbi:MerR family transcriptional regulator [Cytobacillus sp. FJAT-54145]|uniref:Chromosome-anchoring protein RacA n=1 Tax=Cytobacillus spartinae TaxID=3299023 RepID=A0ABW6K5F7_9BACI